MLAHTLGGNFESFCEVNQKFKRFFVFSIPHHTKRKPGGGDKIVRVLSCKLSIAQMPGYIPEPFQILSVWIAAHPLYP